ncbi:hypothetical protein BDF14DRAFT_1181097 [Spinellus fusiger]|nr:hypothetical protein BDF14DRAFT_1181097 [Spinellus fusiger]
MFSFDSFRRTTSTSSVPKNNENASPLLHTAKDTRQTTFLQRMTSADSVLRTATPLARPSLGTGPHLSSTFSSILSSSSSIPVPVNSWAMLTLARLQDSEEFDDIVDLLLAQDKAVLLLPVSRPFYQSTIIDREFIHDHTIVYQSNKAQVISLSGIQGTFQR